MTEQFRVKPIETQRFKLRAVTLDDAADMYEYASDAETVQYTTFPPHTSVENSAESITRFFLTKPDEGKPESFAIVDKTNDKMIGTCDFWPLEETGVWEMGYIINKAYWGQGVMSEVSKAVLDYAFENYDIDVMKLKHVVDNVASGKVALKLGFKPLGIVSEGTSTAQGSFDAMCYEIRKEDMNHE